MSPHLRPDDLKFSPYKEYIHSLSSQCLHTELADTGMSFQAYSTLIRTLLLTTQSTERTSSIVEAVLSQATQLHKSSAWVEEELKFEGMISGADRIDFLRFELEQSDRLDDTLLDRYNERIKRFDRSE